MIDKNILPGMVFENISRETDILFVLYRDENVYYCFAVEKDHHNNLVSCYSYFFEETIKYYYKEI